MIGPRATTFVTPQVGPHVGMTRRSGEVEGDPMENVSIDDDAEIYVPADADEWDDTLTAASISSGGPSAIWLLQEASGNPADVLGAFALTAGGGRTYQSAVTGWTRPGIKTTSGAAGHMISTAAGLPDISTTSALLIMYVTTPIATATLRTLAQLGPNFDAETTARLNSSEQIVLGRAGVETAGAATFCDGATHVVAMKVDRTNNISGIYTDQEKITGAAAGTGKCVMLGGDNSRSWDSDAITYLYAALFTGAAAELSNAQIKTLLETLGWAPGWSP